jgi:hypothetical protein
MHNKYAHNPDKLHAWDSANHIDRAPQREKKPATAHFIGPFLVCLLTLSSIAATAFGVEAQVKKLVVSDADSGMPAGQGFGVSDFVLGSDGFLYGVSNWGGRYNHGVLFETDLDLNAFELIYSAKPEESAPLHITADAKGGLYLSGNGAEGKFIAYDSKTQAIQSGSYMPPPAQGSHHRRRRAGIPEKTGCVFHARGDQ